MAVTAALIEEVGHPVEAVRGGGGARTSKSVALVCERPDIAEPSLNGIGNGGVTLGYLVDPGGRIKLVDETR